MAAPDVIVVGGGVIGCAIAYYLTRAGAQVTVIERGEVGGEASGASAGILAPLELYVESDILRNFCLASLRLFPSLAETLEDETGIDIGYLQSGILRVALSDKDADDLVELFQWQRSQGLPLELIGPEPLRHLEPRLSSEACAAIYSPQEHQVSADRLTQALVQAAVARGAVLHRGMAVTGLVTNGSRVSGVRTRNGRLTAGQVVLAAGCWTAALGRHLGVNLPVRPMRGQMLAFPNFSSPVRHIIFRDDGYLVPKANGFLFVGSTVEDVGFRNNTTTKALAGLRRMAAALVPSLAYVEVVSDWAGLRPGSPDGLPMLGPVPGWEGLSVASGHFRKGILLSPITGRLMAQWLTQGKTEMSLEPFSPARFLASVG
ncbi:MAG: glycine oxidase ThiO [Dehalococcoidia bacterium]